MPLTSMRLLRGATLLAVLALAAPGCAGNGEACRESNVVGTGGLITDQATIEFVLAFASVKHRMDVDRWEDGQITEVTINLQRAEGCLLEVTAAGCLDGSNSLPITTVLFSADAHCPGIPQAREGFYVGSGAGTLGTVQLADPQVPGQEVGTACFASSVQLFIHADLQSVTTGDTLSILPSVLLVEGSFRSLGDYHAHQECNTVISTGDITAADGGDTVPDSPDAESPGPSVTLEVTCDACDTDAALRLRAANGWEIGSPDYALLFHQPSFPFAIELPVTADPAGQETAWLEGPVTFQVWQDTTPGGALPEPGEPASPLATVELVTGHLNKVTLALTVDDEPVVDCAPDSQFCLSLLASARCNPRGDAYQVVECGKDTACSELTGHCESVVCAPSKIACASPTSHHTCLPSGTGYGAATDCSSNHICLNGSCMKEECLAEVVFLVDTSASMALDWDNVANSLSAITAMSPTASFAVIQFPAPGGVCTLPNSPALPLAPNQSEAILNWFGDNVAFGQTPLLGAMEKLNTTLPQLFSTGSGAVVLLSDGADTCAYPELGLAERETLIVQGLGAATQTLWQDHGIKTYVIGYQYQGSPDQLNAIASHGGTGKTTYTEAGNESELTSSLVAIGQDLKLCFE